MPVHNTKTALYITAPQTSVEDLACVILQAHIRLHCEYNYHCSSHIEVMDNEAVSAFKAEVHCTSNYLAFKMQSLPTSVHFLKRICIHHSRMCSSSPTISIVMLILQHRCLIPFILHGIHFRHKKAGGEGIGGNSDNWMCWKSYVLITHFLKSIAELSFQQCIM